MDRILRGYMWYLIRFVFIPFVASLMVSLVATFLIRWIAQRMGLLDRPGAHKQHAQATPSLGGVAVFCAFVVGVLLSGPLSPKLEIILKTSGLLVFVGLLDDLRGVSANKKLATLGLASFLLWKFGICLDAFGLPGPLACVLTFLWLGLVSSAFNGVDNADGSAAGLAAISSFFVFLISWCTWQHDLAVVSLVLAGSCLGFLFFNFPAPRATIFMGDCGSLFLGFGLSTLTVLGQWSSCPWKAAVIAVLLVLVPLFDFLFILLVRGLEGRYRKWDDPIKMCARDHTFHRLRALGLSPRQSLLLLYLGGLLSAGLALRTVLVPSSLTLEGAGRGLIFIVLIGLSLMRVRLKADAYPSGQ